MISGLRRYLLLLAVLFFSFSALAYFSIKREGEVGFAEITLFFIFVALLAIGPILGRNAKNKGNHATHLAALEKEEIALEPIGASAEPALADTKHVDILQPKSGERINQEEGAAQNRDVITSSNRLTSPDDTSDRNSPVVKKLKRFISSWPGSFLVSFLFLYIFAFPEMQSSRSGDLQILYVLFSLQVIFLTFLIWFFSNAVFFNWGNTKSWAAALVKVLGFVMLLIILLALSTCSLFIQNFHWSG